MARLSGVRPRLGGILLAGGLLLAGWPAGGAPTESELKAAYLYNFARYVTWPGAAFASPADPIRICVVDDASFLEVLTAAVAGKRIGDRPVAPEARASADEAGDCHIAYLPSGGAGSVSSLASRSVFTVSGERGFARHGGIANFVTVDHRIRFEINAHAAERAGLQVSSRLLRLAQLVE